ncbi:MAG: TolC family protein [Bdellovibrionaceae bacterium]|nr:TolC family protein [Pseudobdellovibrionaceae bacterium]
MMWVISWIAIVTSSLAQAQSTITLTDYLDSVKANNPSARALMNSIEAAEVKIRRAELSLSAEAYGQYNVFDDRTPPLNPLFAPNRRDGYSWKAGVQKQTQFGLNANLYFENNHIVLGGVAPPFFPLTDYISNRGVLELKQDLWRNSFGERTRADVRTAVASAQSEYYNQRFQLKNLLLEAENTYWAVVTYDQIVSLQEENVERAKKLNDWMSKKVRLKLFDDVDGLQSQTAYEARLLELQSTKNDRAAVVRSFNTLRGMDSDVIGKLEGLPNLESFTAYQKSQFKMRREDFLALKEMAAVQENRAKSERSALKPEVSLVGSVATNGLNPNFTGAYDQVKDWQNPSWTVGVQVRFPLSFGLNSKLYKAAAQDIQSAKDNSANADFRMMRAWEEISQKQTEYQEIYNKAKKIETSQTSLLSKERTRLTNGRTTTFQLLTFEQNLVSAQIQRTRAQLGLIQIKNLLKTFEASNESI